MHDRYKLYYIAIISICFAMVKPVFAQIYDQSGFMPEKKIKLSLVSDEKKLDSEQAVDESQKHKEAFSDAELDDVEPEAGSLMDVAAEDVEVEVQKTILLEGHAAQSAHELFGHYELAARMQWQCERNNDEEHCYCLRKDSWDSFIKAYESFSMRYPEYKMQKISYNYIDVDVHFDGVMPLNNLSALQQHYRGYTCP